MPKLLEHILASKLQVDALVSYRMSLADAAQGYKMFDEKEQDCRKVVLVPGLH